MTTCDYCAEGLPLVNGWHERTDPEGVEGTARIPCPLQATVYVLERNVYSDRSLSGVYATLALAQAAAPGVTWTEHGDGSWRRWDNELDWDDAATVYEFSVLTAGSPK